MTTNEPITEYRRDGWPLCPRCGEDELASHLDATHIDEYYNEHGDTPPIQEYLDAGLSCYGCGWTNHPDFIDRDTRAAARRAGPVRR